MRVVHNMSPLKQIIARAITCAGPKESYSSCRAIYLMDVGAEVIVALASRRQFSWLLMRCKPAGETQALQKSRNEIHQNGSS